MNFSEASRNRRRAIALGERFYQGRDCKKEHGGMRYTKQRVCYRCMLDQSNDWHTNNKTANVELSGAELAKRPR